jgi:predicted MFS family arabinose efflux permease
VTAALTVTGWREIFLLLAAATALAAVAIWRVVPERAQDGPPAAVRELLAGFGAIFTSRLFWRIAPLTIASQATFLAVQGLWSGPWLRDVGGLPPTDVGRHLLFIATAMVAGFLAIGWLAERLGRLGIPALVVAIVAISCFMVSQAVLAMGQTAVLTPAWIAFGFFGTGGILPYAALSQRFAAPLAGRLNTALNVLVFVAAFAQQWWIGWLLERWPGTTATAYAADGYQGAFALMLLLQGAALAWFFLAGRLYPRQVGR